MTVITCLIDNRARFGLSAEHGLSLFIEHGDASVLLDTGQSGAFLDNAELMGVDLAKTTHVVLSHGHYDHSGGISRALAFFARVGAKPLILMHPDAFIRRSIRENGEIKEIGISQENRRLLEERGALLLKKSSVLADGLLYLGQIPRTNKDSCALIGWKENGESDAILDDTGLACTTSQGLVVITGCAHSGISNTIGYARALSGETVVHAVVGGLHCKRMDEALVQRTHDYLASAVRHVYGCHCTGDALLAMGLGQDFMAGDRLEF